MLYTPGGKHGKHRRRRRRRKKNQKKHENILLYRMCLTQYLKTENKKYQSSIKTNLYTHKYLYIV